MAAPVEEYDRPRSELLLKPFFSGQVAPAQARAHIVRYRELQQVALDQLGALEAHLRAQKSHAPDQLYWLITLRHGVHAGRDLLTWCDEALAMLEDDHAA